MGPPGLPLAGPPKALLLDALGTLIELEPPWSRFRIELKRRFGRTFTEKECTVALKAEMAYYRSHCEGARDQESLGNLRRDCAALIRSKLPGGDDLALDGLTETLMASLEFRAFPEVPEALVKLRRLGLRLVVASNWDIDLPRVFDRVGIRTHFDAVVTSAAVGSSKPDLKIFSKALEAGRASSGEAIHVGDTADADIRGARSAGIAAVFITRGDEPPPLPREVPVITGLDQLYAIVELFFSDASA